VTASDTLTIDAVTGAVATDRETGQVIVDETVEDGKHKNYRAGRH
jgi:hypothetical protein